MAYKFVKDQKYTRRNVYTEIGIPEDTKGGNWDTGYARHGNAWFIFCNIGTTGRTGHDYANAWIGDNLEWYGKTQSHVNQQSIRSMLDSDFDVYVFWRKDNQEPFQFAGIGNAIEIENTRPVKILWAFD